MTMGEERRRCYNDFSLRMSSSLSKRWVCYVVENLSKVFLSEQPLILLLVIRVYIVQVKGKKVTFKILQEESFMGSTWVGPTHETVEKLIAQHDSLAFSMCFSCGLFTSNSSRKLLVSQSRNCTNSSTHTQFFTNLILNLIQ